jgi:hypothetical protein
MYTKFIRFITASVCAIATIAFAQSSPPAVQPPGQQGQQSVPPSAGMQNKSSQHHRHHSNETCCGPRNTTGWSMMDKKERGEHREKMHAMKTYDECKAYADEHHSKMVERAKEKSRSVPITPRHDVCAWLKK